LIRLDGRRSRIVEVGSEPGTEILYEYELLYEYCTLAPFMQYVEVFETMARQREAKLALKAELSGRISSDLTYRTVRTETGREHERRL
jgi:hypothetical protein